ncbi:MAG: efflux RND transporter periplasmic adaptor subunit [Bacteroidetes bacterium]|nr:efflux RND transporter periplasmic adaptor subunit [Bacteroidota bacterium]
MRFKIIFLATVAIAFIFYSFGSSKEHQVQKSNAIPVTVAEVISTTAVYYEEYPGMVTALKEINLTAQVSGYITKVNFQDGANVKEGQLLYSIDAQVYEANYQQAKADLQVQEANLIKAQKDADRYRELEQNDAIAKQQVDYANASLEATKMQVDAAKARVASVYAQVKFSNIYAPFTGTIGISQVKVGTAVVAGQTTLNTISTDHPIAVDFTIDQKEIFRFTQLQRDKNILQDSIFTIAFGDEIYPESGTISFIDRAVDPQTGTIKIRLIFANDKELLKPGMNTSVRVKNNTATQFELIPYKSVSESLGEFIVYVVGDSSVVHERQLKLGRQIEDKVIVLDGLKTGETIVVEGVQKLHEGSVIKIEEK